jgi:hypothetical protein
MKRFAFASSVIVLLAFGVVSVFAQAKPAQAPASKAAAPAATTPAATQQAPAAPAKFVKLLKGTADIEFIPSQSKRVGSDIVTVLKIKNMSNTAVSLLKVDEYWYNKGNPPQVITGDTEAYRKPFMPGEVIELTMKSPWKADIGASQYQFSHAGGQVKLKKVTKFD